MQTLTLSPGASTTLTANPVQEIRALHAEIIGHARTTLEKAIRIGELLTAQKKRLKHGQWLPWIEENLPFDRMTAFRYMRVFEGRDEIKCNTVLQISDAYRLLASPTEPEAKPRTAKAVKPRVVAHMELMPQSIPPAYECLASHLQQITARVERFRPHGAKVIAGLSDRQLKTLWDHARQAADAVNDVVMATAEELDARSAKRTA